MDLVGNTQVVTEIEDLGVGDSIFLEKTGRAYWVEEISRRRVILSDVEGRTNTWVRDTLEEAFAADDWVRQGTPPARFENFEEY